jgi:hypothetical protein
LPGGEPPARHRPVRVAGGRLCGERCRQGRGRALGRRGTSWACTRRGLPQCWPREGGGKR